MTDKIKKKKTCKFAQISNKVLFDQRLTFEARGIFAYLHAKPYDWKVLVKNDLVKNHNISEYAVREALKLLKIYGYINWIRLYDKGKIIGIEYELDDEGTLRCDSQHEVSQDEDSQHVDRHNIYNNTDLTNKDLNKKDNMKKNIKKEISEEGKVENSSSSSIQEKEINNEAIISLNNDPLYHFQKFYSAYQKKVDRKQAEKTFFKLWKASKDKDLFVDEIAVCYGIYSQIAGSDLQFWKNPSTFLNNYKDYTEEYLENFKKSKASRELNGWKLLGNTEEYDKDALEEFNLLSEAWKRPGDRTEAKVLYMQMHQKASNKKEFFLMIANRFRNYEAMASENPNFWHSLPKFLNNLDSYTDYEYEKHINNKLTNQ